MELKKAQREQVKIRMSLAAPTGFGKTTGALMIAFGITNDWDKIAVIDTENKSASLYEDHTYKTGFKVGQFNTIQLAPPYTPESYIQAIKACEDAGMEVIIIDSVTHVWNGEGGILEYKDSLGGKFQDWAKVTPRYQKWLGAILHSKCHVITTNRKKQSYSMTNENGRSKVEKSGMDDQIREGYDYEMTIAFDITNDKFLAKASKDRSGLFMDEPEFVITPTVGEKILSWCNKGKMAIPEIFKTLDEKITDAKAVLIDSTKDTLDEDWKSLSKKVRATEEIKSFCAQRIKELGITKPQTV